LLIAAGTGRAPCTRTVTQRRIVLSITTLLAAVVMPGCLSHAPSAPAEPDAAQGTATDDGAAPSTDDAAISPDDGGAIVLPDAGVGDAGSIATDCPGAFVFCEDFENGIDPATWKVVSLAPTIDATRAHRGSKSAHFTDAGQIRSTKPFPTLQNEMWGRVFVYLTQTPPGSTTVPTGPNASFFMAGGGGGVVRHGFRHTGFSGGWNYPGYDQTLPNFGAQGVWPLDQWVCIEWHYQSDPGTGMGTQDYWMDGVYRANMHFPAHPMPPFDYFFIGEYLFGSPHDLWLDDFVLDTKQVGCVQ
jgi:hypothetical protein